MTDNRLIDVWQRARSDNTLAVVEGAQALKHAVRFKAEIISVITCDISNLEKLLDEIAPDVKKSILDLAQEVSDETFKKLARRPHRTKVIAMAKRKADKLSQFDPAKPIVFLEDPKDLENIGAVIRVAAAANAGAVIISGDVDIWHPAVIRGSAGLHWALPVLRLETSDIFALKRVVVAMDPDGEENQPIPDNAVIVFGTERHGVSKELLNKSDSIVRLPMLAGVSSLNLATSVAATLYRL